MIRNEEEHYDYWFNKFTKSLSNEQVMMFAAIMRHKNRQIERALEKVQEMELLKIEVANLKKEVMGHYG